MILGFSKSVQLWLLGLTLLAIAAIYMATLPVAANEECLLTHLLAALLEW
jgi:hypothetical protein